MLSVAIAEFETAAGTHRRGSAPSPSMLSSGAELTLRDISDQLSEVLNACEGKDIPGVCSEALAGRCAESSSQSVTVSLSSTTRSSVAATELVASNSF
jgi:hypothetical protein